MTTSPLPTPTPTLQPISDAKVLLTVIESAGSCCGGSSCAID
ncbi:hypothetical protein [Microbacterium deminutum]